MAKKSEFGEHLKREREMRGVSLEEIASATRISTRFLEALENEQWDRLPGGIFNRGFIRAVARFLGLDEEGLVAEYALATNDPPEVAVFAKSTAGRSSGPRAWLVVLLLIALGAAGYLSFRRYWPLALAWGKSLRHPASTAPASEAPKRPPGTTTAGTAAPGGAEAEQLKLRVGAGKDVSVTVTGDDQILFSGRMKAGESKDFQAKESFRVSASDSSAVLLELNGQTMPPLGSPDQPGSMTLTRQDLRKKPGGPD